MADLNSIKPWILVVLLMIAGGSVKAQGEIEVIRDLEFDLLLNQKRIRADSSELKGYRIQIYFGTDLDEAQKVEMEFRLEYPELADQVYLVYTEPYWRVRVGNYYRPIDAQPDIEKYKHNFDKIFLIKENIELPEIPYIEQ